MPTDLSEKCALVIDNGLFCSFAQRLSRSFGRVVYWTPWQRGFSVLRDNVAGDGLDDIERVDDFWTLIDLGEVDICCFPDIEMSGLQLHLEGIGFPVWGSRAADRLEWDRELFKSMQKKFGLPQPKYRVIVGMENLRSYLKENDNCFIKWSRYRGDMESRRHYTYAQSCQWLDYFEYKMSPFKNSVRFMVEDLLDTDLELGIDTFCVDGEFPDRVVEAIEVKDCGTVGCVKDYADLPEQMTNGIEAFKPFFKEHRYRNMMSNEVRIKDDIGYFTDPCLRHASPAGEPVLELVDNFPEVVWAGAHGELVQPEFGAQYSAQVMIRHKEDEDQWRSIVVPKEVERWVKLYRVCHNGESYQIAPMSPHFQEIGSVIGIGDSIEEALEHLKGNVEAIKDNCIDVNCDALYDALKQAQTAEDEGLPVMTDVPEPEKALE